MNSWQKFSNFFKKFSFSTAQEDKAAQTALFQRNYQAFKELLANNNLVLEIMADMEEKLSGEFLFDRPYIDEKVSVIKEGVKAIVDSLNVITQNQLTQLYDRLQFIEEQISNTISGKKEISEHPLTIFFHEIIKESIDQVGGKNAHLAELGNQADLSVPEGFAITAYAYKRFMEHNRLFEVIHEQLADLPIQDLEILNKTSQAIQNKVLSAQLPQDLEQAIEKAYISLARKTSNDRLKVSVRSSALKEDSEFSFTGQYATFLNTLQPFIAEKYKAVVASLFNPRAIFYYKTKGFQEYDMVMAVGVVEMIDAVAAGVMYSQDPSDLQSSTVIISAVHGLGIPIVDGSVTPETYRIHRDSGKIEIKKKWPEQKTMFICPVEGEPEEIPLPESLLEKPCLELDTVSQLVTYAMDIEKYYNGPQDIEWAVDKHKGIYILQARPLSLTIDMAAKSAPHKMPHYNIILDRGVIACKGIGFGKAFVVKEDRPLEDFPEGAVLITRNTSIKFVPLLSKANAIVTDVGGVASHMASVAREFRIPAIFDTEVSTSIIKDGQDITVDAINCNIYEGLVSELKELAARQEDQFKSTQLFRTLEQVLKKISPLSLLNPDSPNFKPENCETLHDITRYCHEISMRHMFAITDTSFQEIGGAVKLYAGIPTEVFVIDLGGGMERQWKKKLMPEHMSSTPFNALLKGLISMKWPEPRAFDAKGFLGMVAHTAAIQEHELMRMGQQSFAFISASYMNFSIHLGYHLSTIEAYTDDNLNSNYIKFFFKGGGVATDRRLRRVKLIVEVLKKLDFEIKIKEDVIEAIVTKYKKTEIEKKLEILGKLTVYTKQLDMVMYSDEVTNWYIQEFISDHIEIA